MPPVSRASADAAASSMISRRYCRPVPVRSAEAVGAEPLSVVGTVAGRAFSSGTIVEVPLESGAGR
ncbi:MAG: hypothetical protein M3P40_12235, partial [Actinomycetota bacterium]|nr:hypothetical protein [Actinomycetota bacterium]